MANSQNFDYLLPDGSKPDGSSWDAAAAGINSLTIDSAEDWILHPIDSKSWIQVSTELEMSGFRGDYEEDADGAMPIAYARVSINGVDEDKDVVKGTAILTSEFMTLHWNSISKPRARGMRFFHSDLLEVGNADNSGFSIFINYSNSVAKRDSEFLDFGERTFQMTLLPSKDGHENRRALTFWMSLAHNLSQIIPGVKFLGI